MLKKIKISIFKSILNNLSKAVVICSVVYIVLCGLGLLFK